MVIALILAAATPAITPSAPPPCKVETPPSPITITPKDRQMVRRVVRELEATHAVRRDLRDLIRDDDD